MGAPSKGVIVSDGYAEGKTALGGRLPLFNDFVSKVRLPKVCKSLLRVAVASLSSGNG